MSTGPEQPNDDLPPNQYLEADRVLTELGEHGTRRVTGMTAPQILVLGALAGGFITMGALFSLLLGSAVEAEGPKRLLEGFGFATGFFFVILSSAILFTEANVTMPSTVLAARSPGRQIARFWILAVIGNLLGAVLISGLIVLAQDYGPNVEALLDEIIEAKLSWREEGGVGSWLRIVLSGMLANWLVGMAAFFAIMARTIIGKYIPILLAVTLFVSANLQHSPANMGYFSLAEWMGSGPGVDVALSWNILPAGIGNLIGGTLFVVLPLWYGLSLRERRGDR
jgi:formate transporter